MGTRKSGKLSITTDGAESTVEIEGTGQDILFNLLALTHTVANRLQIPLELLALSLPTMMAQFEKEALRGSVLMDLGRMKKDAGETS